MKLADVRTRRNLRRQGWFPPPVPQAIQAHIPKTGGKTIRRWLEKELPAWTVNQRAALATPPPVDYSFLYLGHVRPDFPYRVGLYKQSDVANSFSFVFVRNPYTRAVSLYNHFTRYGFDESFTTFLGHLENVRPGASTRFERRLRAMSKPMVHWTQPPKWPGWTRVFRVENFSEAVEEIRENLGVRSYPVDIDVRPQDIVKSLVSETDAVQIRSLFKTDFETFGYAFEVPDQYQARV